MWQRFTERARKVVFYAQEEAQNRGEGYVSTEHLLLGLVRGDDNVATQVLAKLGVSLSRVRAEVEKQLPRGDTRPSQDMTLTPRAKRVIDLAYDEARNLDNNYIGTEHLLLGLIREHDGFAGRVLENLKVRLEPCRAAVTEIQAISRGGSEPMRPPMPAPTGPINPAVSQATILMHQVMARAWAYAEELGDPSPLTEHILLALSSFDRGLAMEILLAHGLSTEAITKLIRGEDPEADDEVAD